MQQIIFLADLRHLIDNEKPKVAWISVLSKIGGYTYSMYCTVSAFNDLGHPVQLRARTGTIFENDKLGYKEQWKIAETFIKETSARLKAAGIEIREGVFKVDESDVMTAA